jgi:hypothetical protein
MGSCIGFGGLRCQCRSTSVLHCSWPEYIVWVSKNLDMAKSHIFETKVEYSDVSE